MNEKPKMGTTADSASNEHVVVRPLNPKDAKIVAAMNAGMSSSKGKSRPVAEMRGGFDALMESVSPHDGVTFEADILGGISGVWARPSEWRSEEAIVHLHGGWFNFGSARAYRHLVGHIAARAKARTFIPDYRLAPEHPFPAAVDDVVACYRGFEEKGIRRVVLTGDSAGGNLALVLAARITEEATTAGTTLAGVAALSPVTDLTLSGASYETRGDADPLFTRSQVSELVNSYLHGGDPRNPFASPLYSRFLGMPPVRIHVGDAEVLLDDSLRYVEAAANAGVNARLDVWMGMPHGFVVNVGKLAAAEQALCAVGEFLAERLHSGAANKAAK